MPRSSKPISDVGVMLAVDQLVVAYGLVDVLKGVSLNVEAGEIVAIVGANGAGKTTLLSAISGLVHAKAGTVSFNGQSLSGRAVEDIVRLGLAHAPEGRRIFPGLTVAENLLAGAAARPRSEPVEERLAFVYGLFPRLKERRRQRGWSLSGGEQQMLAIGRALMSRPKLLMLDEPSLGLAPIIVEQMFDTIQALNKTAGLSILLVEQNAALALEIAHRAYVLETGSVILSGAANALADDPRVQAAYLGG
jgi:branched-chain amino acid transport system ATP-binding protein